MVSYITGRMQAEGTWKQDPEANIWAQKDEWIRLKNEELRSLYLSANTVKDNKSSILRWVEHIATMG